MLILTLLSGYYLNDDRLRSSSFSFKIMSFVTAKTSKMCNLPRDLLGNGIRFIEHDEKSPSFSRKLSDWSRTQAVNNHGHCDSSTKRRRLDQ